MVENTKEHTPAEPDAEPVTHTADAQQETGIIDDIPDPPMPPVILGAVTEAACQELRRILREEPLDLTKFHDHVFMILDTACKTMMADCQARLNQLSQASPLFEEARISAHSPEGYTVVLVTRKATAPELIESVLKMQSWLKNAGYSDAPIVPF